MVDTINVTNPMDKPKVTLKVVTYKVYPSYKLLESEETIKIYASDIPKKAEELGYYNKQQKLILTYEEYELDYILQKYIES